MKERKRYLKKYIKLQIEAIKLAAEQENRRLDNEFVIEWIEKHAKKFRQKCEEKYWNN